VGVSRDWAIFSGTPYYLTNGTSYGFQIWPAHSEGPSEQKPIKNFREKGVWAYPRTTQLFRVPPIISGMRKATDFKFGQYIQRVHLNKSPLNFFGENGAWAYPGTGQFFRVPPIISGTGKATDFKFGQYIQRVHLNKSPLNFLEKMERGRIQGLRIISGNPLLSQEREKLRISNLASTFRGSIRTKAH